MNLRSCNDARCSPALPHSLRATVIGGLDTVGAKKKECMNRQQQIEAAVVLFAAMLYLTGSFWKAILVSIFVLVSCVLGFGRRWLLWGSFATAIVAIAVVLGAPSPDQWVQLWQDAQHAFSVWLPGY
jgi:uncharacterized membrane protein